MPHPSFHFSPYVALRSFRGEAELQYPPDRNFVANSPRHHHVADAAAHDWPSQVQFAD